MMKSDIDWFNKDWPIEDLKSQYTDIMLNDNTREHAFYNYWLSILKSRAISRTDIEELLEYRKWWGPVSDIIGKLCIYNQLSVKDLHWLYQQLESPDFQFDFNYAKKQLNACIILHDDQQNWKEKLHAFLRQNVIWAAEILLSSIDLQCIDDARQIVNVSTSRKTRPILLAILSKRKPNR